MSNILALPLGTDEVEGIAVAFNVVPRVPRYSRLGFYHTAIILRAPLVADDRYGDEIRDWANATQTTVTVIIQPTSSKEPNEQEATYSQWLMYMPPGTDIQTTDRVSFDNVIAAVDGDPFVFNDRHGNPHHMTVMLVRAEV